METAIGTRGDLFRIYQRILGDPKNMQHVGELNRFITDCPRVFLKRYHQVILSPFCHIFKAIAEDKSSYSNDQKLVIVDCLRSIFTKITVDNEQLFFNIYGFLLFEIYDHLQHKILDIQEDYKLSIMQCTTTVFESISKDLLLSVYTEDNTPKLSQMVYAATELARNEQYRKLKIAAMKCTMSICRVSDEEDLSDIVLRSRVARALSYFLPGITCSLAKVALEDAKVGHEVTTTALRAWGRIVVLFMYDYRPASEQSNNLKNSITTATNGKTDDPKHKNQLDSNVRDNKLKTMIIQFTKLTRYNHDKIKSELLDMASNIVENCFSTMPLSISKLLEIVIILSGDVPESVHYDAVEIIKNVSMRLQSETNNKLMVELEEGFCNAISSLPRKFNGVDETEHVAALCLLIGYFKILGEMNLRSHLLSSTNVENLMSTLLHICEIVPESVSTLEEYPVQDLDYSGQVRPWKQFRYYREIATIEKMEYMCAKLGSYGAFEIIYDYMLEILTKEEHRREAIYLLNCTMLHLPMNQENLVLFHNILKTYQNTEYWYLPLKTGEDDFGCEITLAQVKNNIVQVALLVEGIGNIAATMQLHFKVHLQRTLYFVMERAGSTIPTIKMEGLRALLHISKACGYLNISDLLFFNIDYLTHHIGIRLKRIDEEEYVLDVLAVLLQHCNLSTFCHISDLLQNVLIYSCDKYKAKNTTAFLKIFKLFVLNQIRWSNIVAEDEPIKSKAQKEAEVEHFKVTGITDDKGDFSDAIMGKSAEEMFKEDMENYKKNPKPTDETEPEEYVKPKPPLHITLTVNILRRCAQYLPSKDRLRKLLVLEILTTGVEILKDWEDELLPIVHEIWQPLVPRFAEFTDPLIINFSFNLLRTLARLSKSFIKLRTVKEALPNILIALKNTSKDSYLKDKGSAYRYTQAFKLQLAILNGLGKILAALDAPDNQLNEAMEVAFYYLSNKQPLPLQRTCFEFFIDLSLYDPKIVIDKLEYWKANKTDVEYSENIVKLGEIINSKVELGEDYKNLVN